MCEIARNSVLQSGFPVAEKKHWVGANYHRRGTAGNKVKQSNVPNIRLLFRDELLAEEENWILGLPPPIFPSIKLDQRWKTKKKLHGKGKQLKRVSEHMNYLVAHRTNVPLVLHQEGPQSPSAGPKKVEISTKYDPLGYFAGRERDEKFGSMWKFGRDLDKDGRAKEMERESISVLGSVKRHFVTVSLGIAVGILATVVYQRTMDSSKSRKK